MSNKDNEITPKENQGGQRTFNEELEVAGNQLVERVRELIEEGNVRRLIIRNPEGRTLLEIPLTVGAVAGGAIVIFLGPVLAALAVIGALVARLKIEIVRDEPESIEQDMKEAVRNVKK
ncbi:MAG: DUF4342 domain-containing protein, partial [Chloroflexota bacterium]